MTEAKKRKVDGEIVNINEVNDVHTDETDQLYEEANRALLLAEQGIDAI